METDRRHTNIILIGKEGSGKSTLEKELNRYGFESIKSYTTRPKRDNETGNEYHFVSDDVFDSMFKEKSLVGTREYYTVKGSWMYGVYKDDIKVDKDTVIILDPIGYLEIYPMFNNPFGVYMIPEDDVRLSRLMLRGDDPKEIERREKADNRVFNDFDPMYKDYCHMAIRAQRSVTDDAERVLRYVQKYNRGELSYDDRPEEEADILDEEYGGVLL